MRFARTQLAIAAVFLTVCIGLAVAAIEAHKAAAAVVAMVACAVALYLLLCADEAVQDELDEQIEGQFTD